jgi:hypothetical protein
MNIKKFYFESYIYLLLYSILTKHKIHNLKIFSFPFNDLCFSDFGQSGFFLQHLYIYFRLLFLMNIFNSFVSNLLFYIFYYIYYIYIILTYYNLHLFYHISFPFFNTKQHFIYVIIFC